MIILNGDTQKFQAVLAGAVNTDQPEFQATFGQLNAGVLDTYATNQGELNSTTDVDIVAGVASRQIGIKTISIFNRDDAQVTITFKKDISATDRLIYRVVLAPNESVHYESERGWYVCNANGTERSAAADDHIGQVTGASQLSLAVTAITDQTALAAGLAATDELILSDNGVLKRMDITVLEAYMEANIALPIGQVTGFTDNSTDWDTAFAFGDHAGAGYLTSEVTHTGQVTGDAALTVVVAAITGQTELAAGLAGTDELLLSDGGVIKRMDITVLEVYMEANIALPIGQVTGFTDNSGDWDAAFAFGDHDAVGYLTAVVAGDVNAEASTDGQVLTSDGAGAAAWEDSAGGGGGGGLAWEQVTSADTIAAGEGFAVKNSGAAFDIDLAATIAANDEFVVHNSSESSGQVDVEPNTGHTIKALLGDVVGDTDTLILAPGETVHLIAISSSILEIV